MRKTVFIIGILMFALFSPAMAQEEAQVQEFFARLTLENQGSYFDLFGMKAGQTVYLYAESDEFDTQIIICDINCEEQFAENDDISASNTNSSLEYTFLEDNDYSVLVWDCCADNAQGTFRLLIGLNAPQVLRGQARPTGAAIAIPYETTYIPADEGGQGELAQEDDPLCQFTLTLLEDMGVDTDELLESSRDSGNFCDFLKMFMAQNNISLPEGLVNPLALPADEDKDCSIIQESAMLTPQQIMEALLSNQGGVTLEDMNALMEVLRIFNLAIEQRENWQLTAALENFQEIRRILLSRSHVFPAMTNNLIASSDFFIGNTLSTLGRYEEALSHYEAALASEWTREQPLLVGYIASELAILYYQRGESGAALRELNTSLEFQSKLNEFCGVAIAHNGIGAIYSDQGRYPEALYHLTQAKEINERYGNYDRLAVNWNNLGLIHLRMGRYVAAINAFEELMALTPYENFQDIVGLGLMGLADAYYLQGDLTTSLDYANQVIDHYENHEVQNSLIEAFVIRGQIAHAESQYTQALEDYEQALILLESNFNAQTQLELYFSMALSYIELDDLEQAEKALEQAQNLTVNLLNNAALSTGIQSISESYKNVYKYLTLARIFQDDLEGAFLAVEQGRAVNHRLELQSRDLELATSDKLLQIERDLQFELSAARQAYNVIWSSPDSFTREEIQAVETQLRTAQTQYLQHLERMQLEGGYLERQVAFEGVSLAQIQAILPPDTTLTSYSTSDVMTLVFLVNQNEMSVFYLDVEESELMDLTGSNMLGQLPELYTRLFEPFENIISTSQLIISADSSLQKAPFAAFQRPDGSFLVDDYTISFVASGSVLQLLQDREKVSPTHPALVLAQSDAIGFQSLINAETEAREAAALLGVDPIVDASEEDLWANAKGAEVILIAAHTELNPQAPFYSAILLEETSSFDGRLEVREIYELDLSQGTELVILSGCDTASGGTGEDFGLLTRAFFAAGTPRVVASLWSVDDAATAELLRAFMEARKTANSEAEALRLAMLATRENYPDPYYWASFVLVGQP